MKSKEGLKGLVGKKDYVALAVVDANKYQKVNVNLVKNLVKNRTPGVYVTLSKPLVTIKKILEDAGVDTRLILFIDAITKTISGTEKKGNTLFIGSPDNLSDISIAIDQAVTILPTKEKFIFFDSLSVLLVYNEPATVARFIHLLAGKMHIWKVRGIIVSLRKKEDEELINELLQFCDLKLDF